MKTLITVCLTMFLVLGFSSALIAQEIPGGIVYLEAGNAVYHDFATGQKTNLTAEIPEFQPKGPWTISENGQWFCWFSDGKFSVRNFFSERNLEVKVESFQVINMFSSIDFLAEAGNIKNLTISSGEGDIQIAYESITNSTSFLPTKLTAQEVALLNENSQISLRHQPYLREVYFKQVPNKFNAIVRIKTEEKQAVCYGNTALWIPSVFPCSLQFEINGEKTIGCNPAYFVIDPDGQHEIIGGVPGTKIPLSLLARRDAYFPAWQKASSFQNGEGLLALVYKTESGWGPIEIRRCGASKFGTDKDFELKPRFWQLLVPLSDCAGLAWRPDGSLSYLSESKVFVLNRVQIESGIKKSKVRTTEMKYPPFVILGGMKFPMPVGGTSTQAINNAFPLKPALFARGIKGDKLHWVSDETFLFRGSDKALYSCTNGTIRKLLENTLPGEFSYCSRSPFVPKEKTVDEKNGAIIPTVTEKPKTTIIKPTKAETQVITFKQSPYANFSLGKFNFQWHIGVLKNPVSKENEFIVSADFDLGKETPEVICVENPKITDSTTYEYRPLARPFPDNPSRGTSGYCLKLNKQTLIMKIGNSYLAVKPIKIEDMDEVLKAKDFNHGDTLTNGSLTIEITYWEAIGNEDDSKALQQSQK